MSLFFAISFGLAIVVFVGGLFFKIRQYWQTEAPLKIPTTPAPITTGGVWLRMGRELVFFESLFKSNKWIWLFGWLFHASLVLVLARHLRYFQSEPWFWVNLIQPFGKYAAWGMLIGLTGLLVRRFVVDRVRYISSPSDYLMLILLIMIGGTGLLMQIIFRTDIILLQQFFLNLMALQISAFPDGVTLVLHLLGVLILLLIFPFSKLLHAPGIFFSPTRNQVDNPREKRHVNSWVDQSNNGSAD
ncbi:MAG: nitrate reductase gamma subunit [Gammaproteobacteria bacterium]|jgi:nitrate reductase gamma subunit